MKKWICALVALWVGLTPLLAAQAEETGTTIPTAAQLLGTWKFNEAQDASASEVMSELTFREDGTMVSIIDGEDQPAIPFCTRGGALVALMGEEIMAVKVALKDEGTLLFAEMEYLREKPGAEALSLNNGLLGTWRSEDIPGMTWVFKRDGSAQSLMDDQLVFDMVYLATGNTLIYGESDWVFHAYNFRLNADGSLVLYEDGGKQLRFVRIQAPEPDPAEDMKESV